MRYEENLEMLENFILDVCEILKIAEPIISFDTSKFRTETTLAQVNPFENIIYFNAKAKTILDVYYATAHELRHLWQWKNNYELYFSNYKNANLCTSTDEYNLQIAEIDANAFAELIMIDFFHIKPLQKKLSDKVRVKIQERINYIINS